MKLDQTTLKDVAKYLNLSISTVSRALRNLPDVNVDTRRLVMQTAEELAYQPNVSARNLLSRKTQTIGIVIPSTFIPFYASVIDGVHEVASQHGYNVIIRVSNESYKQEEKNVKLMLASHVDGVLISLTQETQDDKHLQTLLRKRMPLVLFDRIIEELNVNRVVINNYDSAFQATEHLIRNGYRRIAHLAGPPALMVTKRRLTGYQDALRKNGIPLVGEWIHNCNFTVEEGERLTHQLLDLPEKPDAILAVCDAVGFGAMKAIQQRGLRVSTDVGVIGFTNEPAAELVTPTLTTVAQPARRIGIKATELLFDQITTDELLPPRLYTLPTELKVRNSACGLGMIQTSKNESTFHPASSKSAF